MTLEPTRTLEQMPAPTPDKPAAGLPRTATAPLLKRIIAVANPFVAPLVPRATSPARLVPTSAAQRGLKLLHERAALEAALIFETDGKDVFPFRTAIASGNDRSGVWHGMELSAAGFGESWSRFQKFGFLEFPALAAVGSESADRLAFRTAFQANAAECLTLIRVKSENASDAIVAVFSKQAVQVHLPAFHSATLATAQAA